MRGTILEDTKYIDCVCGINRHIDNIFDRMFFAAVVCKVVYRKHSKME